MAAGLGSYAVATGCTAIALAVLALFGVMERIFEQRGGESTDPRRVEREDR